MCISVCVCVCVSITYLPTSFNLYISTICIPTGLQAMLTNAVWSCSSIGSSGELKGLSVISWIISGCCDDGEVVGGDSMSDDRMRCTTVAALNCSMDSTEFLPPYRGLGIHVGATTFCQPCTQCEAALAMEQAAYE